jgi:hypothetical protein
MDPKQVEQLRVQMDEAAKNPGNVRAILYVLRDAQKGSTTVSAVLTPDFGRRDTEALCGFMDQLARKYLPGY